jgi:hypothetical protein
MMSDDRFVQASLKIAEIGFLVRETVGPHVEIAAHIKLKTKINVT